MSNIAIRKALEMRLADLPDIPDIAWENSNYKPLAGVPYIEPNLLFTRPDDVGFRNSPFIQRGYLQLDLRYPTNTGPNAAQIEAEELRAWFFRGLSLVAENIATNIDATPEITNGKIEDGRYVIRVIVYFFAHIDPEASPAPMLDLPSQEW